MPKTVLWVESDTGQLFIPVPHSAPKPLSPWIGHIETRIYRSICQGPLSFDIIAGFYCKLCFTAFFFYFFISWFELKSFLVLSFMSFFCLTEVDALFLSLSLEVSPCGSCPWRIRGGRSLLASLEKTTEGWARSKRLQFSLASVERGRLSTIFPLQRVVSTRWTHSKWVNEASICWARRPIKTLSWSQQAHWTS